MKIFILKKFGKMGIFARFKIFQLIFFHIQTLKINKQKAEASSKGKLVIFLHYGQIRKELVISGESPWFLHRNNAKYVVVHYFLCRLHVH